MFPIKTKKPAPKTPFPAKGAKKAPPAKGGMPPMKFAKGGKVKAC
jgi:hypothetical protein